MHIYIKLVTAGMPNADHCVLFQCRSDLKSDEEIFADKSREVKQLAEQLQEMVGPFAPEQFTA